MNRRGAVRRGTAVFINSRFGSNLVGLSTPTVLYCMGEGSIELGDHSGLSGAILSAKTCIRIGKYAKIGGNVRIYDHDYHALCPESRRDPNTDHFECRSEAAMIGDDVLIGVNAIVLKGVKIGDRAIVGAGSVVSRDIPPDEVWAGNPARFVGHVRRSRTVGVVG